MSRTQDQNNLGNPLPDYFPPRRSYDRVIEQENHVVLPHLECDIHKIYNKKVLESQAKILEHRSSLLTAELEKKALLKVMKDLQEEIKTGKKKLTQMDEFINKKENEGKTNNDKLSPFKVNECKLCNIVFTSHAHFRRHQRSAHCEVISITSRIYAIGNTISTALSNLKKIFGRN